MQRLAETTRRTPRSLALVVLAAGKGKRMHSSLAKVLHPIAGRPALWHVLQAGMVAKPNKVIVVVGHDADQVEVAVRSWGITPTPVFVRQRSQLGTGHAVLAAERAVGRSDDVLVMGGDYDPVTGEDVKRLVASHRRGSAVATTASTELDEPGGYGRVVRRGPRLLEIVEEIDASPDIRAIREVWIVLAVFRRKELFAALPKLDRKNRQREYYLNRVIPMFLGDGHRVTVISVDTGGVMGVNSLGGLAAVDRVVRGRINARHMARGVTVIDPMTTYIDVDVSIAAGTVIRPLTFLEGASTIGAGCDIGPSTRLTDCEIGDRCRVTFAVGELARVGEGVGVGPFAYLRPDADLADGVHVGSYVEIKASTVGRASKVPHLSYVGDAEIGAGTNIGAATVFVNYDGYAKHRTTVGDDVRIGSDTMLVAPVTVGNGAVTGAGSVITKDVPPGALAVARGDQHTIEGYRSRKDAERGGKSRIDERGGK
jgi:bifunctional UDP-N-acetylglucosamine pyrophosphorylase/glucosamine-1-phosphate N-acetyltransferase